MFDFQSIPHHSPPLHFSIDRFDTLHIHQRRHARLKNNPHQIRFFHRKLAERLQHVVWTLENASSPHNGSATSEAMEAVN